MLNDFITYWNGSDLDKAYLHKHMSHTTYLLYKQERAITRLLLGYLFVVNLVLILPLGGS